MRKKRPAQLLTRPQFQRAVFDRDGHRCVVCGADAVQGDGLDAHHLLDRKLWTAPGEEGGYFVDNGATLCQAHHLEAEETRISPEALRSKAGIVRVLIPTTLPGLEPGESFDKWGNVTRPSGRRRPGSLFGDEGMQRALARGGALGLFDAEATAVGGDCNALCGERQVMKRRDCFRSTVRRRKALAMALGVFMPPALAAKSVESGGVPTAFPSNGRVARPDASQVCRDMQRCHTEDAFPLFVARSGCVPGASGWNAAATSTNASFTQRLSSSATQGSTSLYFYGVLQGTWGPEARDIVDNGSKSSALGATRETTKIDGGGSYLPRCPITRVEGRQNTARPGDGTIAACEILDLLAIVGLALSYLRFVIADAHCFCRQVNSYRSYRSCRQVRRDAEGI